MNQLIEDILTVLAATVLADKRIFAEEIEAFVESSKSICRELEMDPPLSEAKLLSWFEINRDKIKQKLRHNNFESWFEALLKRLNENSILSDLLEHMDFIAKSDGELHVSEKALQVLFTQQR